MIKAMAERVGRVSREPLWVALALVGALALSLTLGFFLSGTKGLIVALLPLGLLVILLVLYNPYPFWLAYFFLIPFSYILADYLPMESFVRFAGLFLTGLTIPSILSSKRSGSFIITPLGASLILFLTGSILSLLAFFDLEKSFMGVGLFFGNILSYWIFINILNSEKRVKTVVNIFILNLIIQCAIALGQKLTGVAVLRATGTITDPNYFGFWLLPFICFSFYYGVATKNKWHKLLYFGAYALMTLTLPLTYSRSMLIVLLPTQFILYWRQRKLLLFFAVSIVVVFLLYLGFQDFFSGGMSIYSFLRSTRSASVDWRGYFALLSFKIFWDHPLVGVGADCFRWIFQYYSTTSARNAAPVIHNAFLEILTGTGLVGFIPFVGVLFFSLRNFWRSRKYYKEKNDRSRMLEMEGLFVGFGSSLMAHFFLSTQHNITLFLFIAFSTIVVNYSINSDKNSITEKSSSKVEISSKTERKKLRQPKKPALKQKVTRKKL
jgi:O-antigen ligase